MPDVLSSAYIGGKNTLNDTNPFLWLVKVVVGDGAGDRTQCFNCNASEDLIWNGLNWIAIAVTIGVMRFARGEMPQTTISIADPDGVVLGKVEEFHGAGDAQIDIYKVYFGDLTETSQVPQYSFENMGVRVAGLHVHFTLGIRNNPAAQMDPDERMLKDFCPFGFPNAADPRCPYTGGTYSTCDRTLADCRVRNGALAYRFGGWVSMGNNGVIV